MAPPLPRPPPPSSHPAPSKQFFQKQDNTMNDAVMIALAVSGLYLVFKVFETLETM
jgi:hypothetical protein